MTDYIDRCSECGADSLTPVTETRDVRAPDGERLPFDDVFTRCGACGAEFYLQGQALETSRNRAAVLREHEGLLTPDQIRGIREQYGLSQAELEELLGFGAKTVVRWERGSVTQSRAADKLLRLLARGGPDAVRVSNEEFAWVSSFFLPASTFQEHVTENLSVYAARFSSEWPVPQHAFGGAILRASNVGWFEGWEPYAGIIINVPPPPGAAAYTVTYTRAADLAARAA